VACFALFQTGLNDICFDLCFIVKKHVFSDTCLLQLFIYYSLKKQNFGLRMAAFKFLLIVSFYRFLIEKNVTALQTTCLIDTDTYQQHDQAWTWKLSFSV